MVVVGVGQLYGITLLDGGLVHAGGKHYFRGAAVTATASTAACRNVSRGYFRAALVGKREAHRILIVAQFSRHAEDGTCLHLIEFGCHGLILDRIGTVSVEALVYVDIVYREAHVALCVGCLLPAVHRQALYRACAAEVLPTGFLLPAVDVGSDKLLRAPFTQTFLKGDAAAFGTLLFLNHLDGCP
ncbi:hypothetical protein [Prevotella falsenii]